ncbi:MAG: hypothetical protein F4Y39_09365 [Gemmatimonadetes bacterium]|nr:hypothetical protein [Gemmatimonadota bacterium]MYF74781.1 hypothetical protein [Gemmatimonadota bacterium]MYK53070.1 hypothetical protein [Gemmatimonadota bacterium]
MTFKARYIFLPIAAIALGICVFVVFLDYRDAFHRALNVPPTSHYADDIPNLVTAYYTRSDASDIEWILSEALAPQQPIRRLVFALFLAYTPEEERIAAFLHYAAFGPVQGLERASLYHFDIHHSKLTAGEVLLLCDLAQGADVPMNDPIAALERRDAILSDLYARGFLSQAVYRSERDRALSLSVNPIPVK